MVRLAEICAAMYLMFKLQGWKFHLPECLLCRRRGEHAPNCPVRKLGR